MDVLPVCSDVKGLINEYLMISKQDVEGLRKRNAHFLNMLFEHASLKSRKYMGSRVKFHNPRFSMVQIMCDSSHCYVCKQHTHIRMETLCDSMICLKCDEERNAELSDD